MLNKHETQHPYESLNPKPVSLIQKLSAIISAALGVKIIEILTLSMYFYILSYFHTHRGIPDSALTRLLQFIPMVVIYYLSLALFLYILFNWRRKLTKGGMPRLFTMYPVVRFSIFILLSLVFIETYWLFSYVMKHSVLVGVGQEHPTLQTFLRILMYLMFTINNYLLVFVWLWWFYDAASRLRGALFGICAWFVFTAVFIQILELILSIIKTFTFTEIGHRLHREMISNAKIALIAFVIFYVVTKISEYIKGQQEEIVIGQ
ncbi:hypothetical protein ACFL60_01080 [Candidatus Omnitrophota bacterium]